MRKYLEQTNWRQTIIKHLTQSERDALTQHETLCVRSDIRLGASYELFQGVRTRLLAAVKIGEKERKKRYKIIKNIINERKCLPEKKKKI